MDLEGAFDCVPHSKLLEKLAALKMNPFVYNWICEFLCNRKFLVNVNKTNCVEHRITRGVPQGAILSPFLFNLFIADISDDLKCGNLLYADDLKLFYRSDSVNHCQHLQNDLNTVNKWANDNDMKFSAPKCKLLRIGKAKACPFQYTLGNHTLELVEVYKDLGVIVDENLNFHRQSQQVILKAKKVLYVLKSVFKYWSKDITKFLFNTYIKPILTYCTQIWLPTFKKDRDAIELVLRSFTKRCHGLKNLSYADRLKTLGLPTMEDTFKMNELKLIYDLWQNYIFVPKEWFFEKSNVSRTRGHSRKIVKPKFNRNVGRSCLFCRRVSDWNELPADLVNAPSARQWYTLYKKYCS
jgi:hypothetical protein